MLAASASAADLTTPDSAAADLAHLAAGEIVVDTNVSMKLPRGISARASYFIPAPPEKVRDFLPLWNPQPNSELAIQQFHHFPPDAGPEFVSLRFDEKAGSVRKLLAAMRDREGLQLTRAELARIPSKPIAESAREFWSGVLNERWQSFLGTGLNAPAGNGFDARGEISALLAEEPKVGAHFAALLGETPLSLDGAAKPVRCYWQQKTINGVAGLTMGAIYRRDSQLADFEFYVSSGYLVSCTLYDFRAAEVGGTSGTLVWQENFASSPLLTGAFGLKRKLATMAIESETRRVIRAFRKDAAK